MPSREPTAASTLREWAKKIKSPRFDRIVVHDLRSFKRIPRSSPTSAAFSPLLGFPIYTDEKVEVGVIELRLGDEVVERVHLSELRA